MGGSSFSVARAKSVTRDISAEEPKAEKPKIAEPKIVKPKTEEPKEQKTKESELPEKGDAALQPHEASAEATPEPQ
jgi:hypothetical protein